VEKYVKEEIPFVDFDAVDDEMYTIDNDDVVFLRVGAVVNETIDDTGMISACPPLSPLFESPSSPDVPLEEADDDESDDVVPPHYFTVVRISSGHSVGRSWNPSWISSSLLHLSFYEERICEPEAPGQHD
jgi:hypothetical protein